MSTEILSASEEHTPAWHATRSTGIGGSDIASIVGSGYLSPYAVWAQKTDPDAHATTGNLQMRRGNALEPIVAEEFATETGLELTDTGTWRRDDKHHHIANPDRLTNDGGGLEIKCTSSLNLDRYWDDDTPRESAALQAHWCMHVTGRTHWWIAAWCWEKSLQIYRLEYDSETIAWLTSEVDDMWDRIQTGNPPDLDSHPTTGEALSKRWLAKFGSEIDNPEWSTCYGEYKELMRARRSFDDKMNLLKNQIMEGMGDATEAFADGKRVATWRESKNGTRIFRWKQ